MNKESTMKMYTVGKIGLSFLRRFDFAISATSFFLTAKRIILLSYFTTML